MPDPIDREGADLTTEFSVSLLDKAARALFDSMIGVIANAPARDRAAGPLTLQITPKLTYAGVRIAPGRYASDFSFLVLRCSIDGTEIRVVGGVPGLPAQLGQVDRVIRPSGEISLMLALTQEQELRDGNQVVIRQAGALSIEWLFSQADSRGVSETSILAAPIVVLFLAGVLITGGQRAYDRARQQITSAVEDAVREGFTEEQKKRGAEPQMILPALPPPPGNSITFFGWEADDLLLRTWRNDNGRPLPPYPGSAIFDVNPVTLADGSRVLALEQGDIAIKIRNRALLADWIRPPLIASLGIAGAGTWLPDHPLWFFGPAPIAVGGLPVGVNLLSLIGGVDDHSRLVFACGFELEVPNVIAVGMSLELIVVLERSGPAEAPTGLRPRLLIPESEASAQAWQRSQTPWPVHVSVGDLEDLKKVIAKPLVAAAGASLGSRDAVSFTAQTAEGMMITVSGVERIGLNDGTPGHRRVQVTPFDIVDDPFQAHGLRLIASLAIRRV